MSSNGEPLVFDNRRIRPDGGVGTSQFVPGTYGEGAPEAFPPEMRDGAQPQPADVSKADTAPALAAAPSQAVAERGLGHETADEQGGDANSTAPLASKPVPTGPTVFDGELVDKAQAPPNLQHDPATAAPEQRRGISKPPRLQRVVNFLNFLSQGPDSRDGGGTTTMPRTSVQAPAVGEGLTQPPMTPRAGQTPLDTTSQVVEVAPISTEERNRLFVDYAARTAAEIASQEYEARPATVILGETPFTVTLGDHIEGIASTLARRVQELQKNGEAQSRRKRDTSVPEVLSNDVLKVVADRATEEVLPMSGVGPEHAMIAFAEDIFGGEVPDMSFTVGNYTLYLLSQSQDEQFMAYAAKTPISHGGVLQSEDPTATPINVKDATYIVATNSAELPRSWGVRGYVARRLDVGVLHQGLPGLVGAVVAENGTPLRGLVVEALSAEGKTHVLNEALRLQSAATTTSARLAFTREVEPLAMQRQIIQAIGTFRQPNAPWTTPTASTIPTKMSALEAHATQQPASPPLPSAFGATEHAGPMHLDSKIDPKIREMVVASRPSIGLVPEAKDERKPFVPGEFAG